MSSNGNRSVVRASLLGLFVLIVAAFFFLLIGHGGAARTGAGGSPTGKWTCSMCPQFILPEAGKCPKCFMDLIPLEEGFGGGRLELGLKPEAAALAGIETSVVERSWEEGSEDELPRIPVAAVLENIGRRFVYTEGMDGEYLVFTLREIVTGRRFGGEVEVVRGLDEGEVVVSRGAFRIDSAMQIQGKASLVNLPDGDLADADDVEMEEYQPAERSGVDLRGGGVPVDDWFLGYEAVRAALARDDFSGSGSAAERFLEGIGGMGDVGGGEFASLRARLAEHVGELAGAGTLDGRRDGFERVSGDMTFLARRYGAPGGGLNLVFCPMAFGGEGAYWLQPQETVDNPYHGLEMPLCGWQVDRIAGASE